MVTSGQESNTHQAESALHLKPSCGTQGLSDEDLMSTANAISLNGHDPLVPTSPNSHNNSDVSVTLLPPSCEWYETHGRREGNWRQNKVKCLLSEFHSQVMTHYCRTSRPVEDSCRSPKDQSDPHLQYQSSQEDQKFRRTLRPLDINTAP